MKDNKDFKPESIIVLPEQIIKKERVNTMIKTIISATLIFLGIAMMAGSAGDCDGKCVENANSLIEMFMYALGGMALMLSGGFIMLKTQ